LVRAHEPTRAHPVELGAARRARYTAEVTFREKLVETLRAIRPILEIPGVLVVGSDVPNLLEPNAASTLVVSQDVDIAVPIEIHSKVKAQLPELRDLSQSPDEPSVWVPKHPGLIEVNFIGMDRTVSDPGRAFVFDDTELPLLVFGALSLLEPGQPAEIDDLKVPLPEAAGLMLEKLLTDRSGIKGDRDLLVVLALLLVSQSESLEKLAAGYRLLAPEHRYTVRSNLSALSLIAGVAGMPDPAPHRALVASLLRRLDEQEHAQ
jgi:hypothetical protein